MAHSKVIMIGTRDNLQKIYDSVGDSSAETSAELAFGYENYYDGGVFCIRSGITEIREATKCEKYSLIRLEIETDTL